MVYIIRVFLGYYSSAEMTYSHSHFFGLENMCNLLELGLSNFRHYGYFSSLAWSPSIDFFFFFVALQEVKTVHLYCFVPLDKFQVSS